MVGCLVLLATGLVGLLLLNVNLEHGAYVLERLQTRQQQLQEQQQALQEQLNSLQAPGNLAARAAKLGMVPDPGVAFVRAGSGKVLGVPSPVVASPSPTVSKASPAGGTSASGAPSRGTGRAAARSPSTGAATSAPTPTP